MAGTGRPLERFSQTPPAGIPEVWYLGLEPRSAHCATSRWSSEIPETNL